MTMPQIESGLQNHRVQFVRETTVGTTPSDPTWRLFSDIVTRAEWAPNANIGAIRGIGDVDPADHLSAPEAHQLTIRYYVQHSFTSTADAAYDGLARDNDNRLPATHSVVIRRSEESGGDDSNGFRTYTVGEGGHVDRVTLPGDPGAADYIPVELMYQCEKVRSYEIHQPGAADSLTVESTSASDTSQTVTIETQGADKTETINLNGTTAVASTDSFSDIDAVRLSAECVGNVIVKRKSSGQQLAIIYGSEEYNDVEGDLGIPLLGSGANGAAIGTDYEHFLGDTVERPAGTDLAYDLNSLNLTVNNNLDMTPRLGTLKQRIHAGVRDVTVAATLLGERESHKKIVEHLKVTTHNIVWTLTRNTLQVDNAVLITPGNRMIEAGQAFLQLNNTFEGEGLTIS